jgi:hypothetical protein
MGCTLPPAARSLVPLAETVNTGNTREQNQHRIKKTPFFIFLLQKNIRNPQGESPRQQKAA